MSSDWITCCDALADAGIINFDAPAYITGTKPRYVGTPQMPLIKIPPLNQPAKDEFTHSSKVDNSIVKNPLWKKVLFSVLAAGGLILGIKKLGKLPSVFKTIGEKLSAPFKKIFKK